MATKGGHPFCTKWKNYQYSMTRAIEGIDYVTIGASAPFDTYPPDIYMNDDHIFDADTKNITYAIAMDNSNPDKLTTQWRPDYWIDNIPGTSNLAGPPVSFKLTNGAWETAELYSLSPSRGHVISSRLGKPITLFTMNPGMMVGLPREEEADEDAYGVFSAYQWKLKNPESNCLHTRNKLMNNCNTCWIKYPETPGDSVITDILPGPQLNNKGFSIYWNINRHIPKIQSGTYMGINCFVQGSINATGKIGSGDWVTITQLTSDPDICTSGDTDNYMLAFAFDTHELGGGDFPFKRLKFETLGTGSPGVPIVGNFIQIGITPTN